MPTSNLTGVNIFAEVLTPKRQELLHELVPTAPLVAMLVNPTSAQTQSEVRNVQAAVQQATAFETVVNLKAVRALGVTIPTGILLRADEVIE